MSMKASMSTSTTTTTKPRNSRLGLWLAGTVWALLTGSAACLLQQHFMGSTDLATATATQPLPQQQASQPRSPKQAERGMQPQAPSTEAAPAPQPEEPALPPITTIPLPQDPAIAQQACAPWLKRWPSIRAKTCHQAQLSPSEAVSVKGVPIVWRDVAPLQTPAARRVLVTGAIHGDELTSAVLALNWIPKALEDVQQRSIHWRFIPVLNPDGFLARPATRMNASGVDLNRNFPTPDWKEEAPKYWKERTRSDPRRWPGPAPLSEPESRFLHDQITDFAPDLVVSIHAPYGILDFDGPQSPPERIGHLWLDQLGVFPGSLGYYSGLQLKVPVVTIELEHALDDPPAKESAAMWNDLIEWLDKHLPENTDPESGHPY